MKCANPACGAEIVEPVTETELIEALAKLEHEQWAHIIKYLLEKGLLHLARYESFRYKQLADTPYEKLSEPQKESDREWARRALDMVKASLGNFVYCRSCGTVIYKESVQK